MSEKQWSPQQAAALTAVRNWLARTGYKSDAQVFYLAGFAGTGKTTLAKHFAEDYETLFAAYTGKAALQMRKSGIPGASTIHSLLYSLVPPSSKLISELEQKIAAAPTAELIEQLRKARQPQFVLRQDSDIIDADLLVLDECSMIDEPMAKDILSFGKPVLVLGDPMQLPPVKGTGYFTAREPDILLTEIHRQALDNPIIALSKHVREGGAIPYNFADNVKRLRPGEFAPHYARDASQIICGKNATRREWNRRMRAALGFTATYPVAGDKLICLRNNGELGIFNGMFTEATSDASPVVNYSIKVPMLTELGRELENVPCLSTVFDGIDTDKSPCPYWRLRELEQFDYGYCITVHKAQGSQFDKLLLVDDKFLVWDKPARTRWLYTAVTRAVESIVVA